MDEFEAMQLDLNEGFNLDDHGAQPVASAANLRVVEPAPATQNKFLDVPYEQRWECLRPVIIQLYLGEKLSIAALADRMRDQYSFSAV